MKTGKTDENFSSNRDKLIKRSINYNTMFNILSDTKKSETF